MYGYWQMQTVDIIYPVTIYIFYHVISFTVCLSHVLV